MLLGVGEDVGSELLPELVIDVLHRVDAEPVHAEVPDPRLVDVRHAGHDRRVFGEQVVQAEEVAIEGVLAGEGGVAAVVVQRRVIEPGRNLEVLFRRIKHRRVREGGPGVELREVRLAGEVPVIEGVARGGAVRLLVLGDVAGAGALLVADDVRRVVGDDVEVHLHAARVGLVDQRFQFGVGAQVRIDLGEVRDPVAVVTGGVVLGLDRLVLEARGQPDRRGPEPLDVVDLVQQAVQVSAVVEALAGGVEAGDHRIRSQAALVVAGVAVAESVRHDEVEVLAGDGSAKGMGPCSGFGARRRSRGFGGGCGLGGCWSAGLLWLARPARVRPTQPAGWRARCRQSCSGGLGGNAGAARGIAGGEGR